MATTVHEVHRAVCDDCGDVFHDGWGRIVKMSTLKDLVFELKTACWDVDDVGRVRCDLCLETEGMINDAKATA